MAQISYHYFCPKLKKLRTINVQCASIYQTENQDGGFFLCLIERNIPEISNLRFDKIHFFELMFALDKLHLKKAAESASDEAIKTIFTKNVLFQRYLVELFMTALPKLQPKQEEVLELFEQLKDKNETI